MMPSPSYADLVFLFGATIFLLALTACFTALAVYVFCELDLIDVRAIRRLLRQRRFGMVSMFGLTAVVAIDIALLRLMGIDVASPGAICPAVFVSGFAVAIVGFVWLVLSDFNILR